MALLFRTTHFALFLPQGLFVRLLISCWLGNGSTHQCGRKWFL